MFKNYGDRIKFIFEEALEKKDILEYEKEIIYESGLAKKFSVPSEIIEIIAEYAMEKRPYFEIEDF